MPRTPTRRPPRMPRVPTEAISRKGKNVYGSLTKSADLLDDRVSEVSNVNKTISTMQKNVNKKVRETKREVEDNKKDKDLEETHKSINAVLAKLGETVAALGTGITNVTVATAKATKDAIGQYASAVGRDINYNKQNMVAMALSSSTPIFGYFAAKFMETDVFRKAKEKISTSMSNMFGSIFRRLRFKRKGNKDEYDIPHMARGGIVKKAGMAKLHAAEVVMPVDKYLKASQKSQEAFTNRLAKVQAKVFKQAIGYETIGGEYREKRKMSYQDRMIELVTSIEHALYEQKAPGFWKKLFDNLMKNKLFSGMIHFFGTIKRVITSPYRALRTLSAPFRWLYRVGKQRWRVDRGYWGDLPRGRSVLESMNSIMGMTYAQQMSRLDQIILFTKATAQATRDLSTAVTGISYQSIPDISRGSGGFSIFGVMWKMLTKPTEWLAKGSLLGIEKAFGVKTGHIREALTKDILEGFKKWKYDKFTSKKQKELDSHPLLQLGLHGTGRTDKNFITNQKTYYDVMIHSKRKGFPRLLTLTQNIIDELQTINSRERRRTVTSMLGKIFGGVGGAIGNVFSSIMGLFKPGGMLGWLGTIAGFLFGSGAAGAGGGLIGNAMKKIGAFLFGGLGSFIDLFKKEGLIGKGLSWAVKSIGSLGSTILTGIRGWAPKLLPFLKSAGWIAAAGSAGYAIGTYINEDLGLGKKIQDWLDGQVGKVKKAIDEKEDPNYAQNLAKKVASGKGSKEDFRSRQELALRSRLGNQSDSIGFIGANYLDSIEKAQRQYISANLDKYLKYDPDHISEMRYKWMNSNFGIRGALPFENVESYARRREESFLKYMSVVGHELTDAEQAEKYKKFSDQYKTILDKANDAAIEYKKVMIDNIGKAVVVVEDLTKKSIREGQELAIKGTAAVKEYGQTGIDLGKEYYNKGLENLDSITEKASDVIELTEESFEKRKQQLQNMLSEKMAPVTAITKKIDEQTKDYQNMAKEQGKNIVQGAGHLATSIGNHISQSTQNIVNNGGSKTTSFINTWKENIMVMKPDFFP